MAFQFLENKFESHYLNIDTGITTRAPIYYEKKAQITESHKLILYSELKQA